MKVNKKILTALTLAAVFSGSNFSQAAIDSNFSKNFSEPTTDNRPLTRWWIPGANITKNEIRKEIQSMAAAGFGGADSCSCSDGRRQRQRTN